MTERDAARDALGLSRERARYELMRAALTGVLADPQVREALMRGLSPKQRETPQRALAIVAERLAEVALYVATSPPRTSNATQEEGGGVAPF